MKTIGLGPRTRSAALLAVLASLALPQLAQWSSCGGLAAQEDDREAREAAEAAELARRDSLRRIFDPAGAFEPLDLPAPGEFRDAAGAPVAASTWQCGRTHRFEPR